MNPTKICDHCRKLLVISARGLCSACYHKPAVRALYPTRRAVPPDLAEPEPTLAELEALIARRLPTMPPTTEKAAGPRPRKVLAVRYRRGRLAVYGEVTL